MAAAREVAQNTVKQKRCTKFGRDRHRPSPCF